MQKIDVLVVEDNPHDVFLVREALNSESIPHALRVIQDGEEALGFVTRMGEEGFQCPDLILLDLNLPKVRGVDVLSRLRQHCTGADTPVIAYSSSAAPEDRERVEALHARFFPKPNNLDAWMRLGEIVRDLTQR